MSVRQAVPREEKSGGPYQAARRGAALAGGADGGKENAADGHVDVGVVHHCIASAESAR